MQKSKAGIITPSDQNKVWEYFKRVLTPTAVNKEKHHDLQRQLTVQLAIRDTRKSRTKRRQREKK